MNVTQIYFHCTTSKRNKTTFFLNDPSSTAKQVFKSMLIHQELELPLSCGFLLCYE